MKEPLLLLDCAIEAWMDRNSEKVKKYTSKIYALFHLIFGFYILWFVKYEINQLLVLINKNNVLAESILETAWILVCVYWGNLGWDRYKSLKYSGKFEHLSHYLLLESAPLLLGLPLMVSCFEAYANLAVYSHSLILGFNSPIFIWVGCAIFYVIAARIYRWTQRDV
jgi:hypothetical protein